jgi:hypothetical protein
MTNAMMFFVVAFAAYGMLKCDFNIRMCITAILLMVGMKDVLISVGPLIGAETCHVGALFDADWHE